MDWLSQPGLTPDAKLARLCYLLTVGSGMNVKVLIEMAPECANQMNNMKFVGSTPSEEHIGALAFLMRQGYAEKAANAACDQAKKLIQSKDFWSLKQLKDLLKTWEDIYAKEGAEHSKKTCGRGATTSGNTYLQKLILFLETGKGKAGAKFSFKDWRNACRLLGYMCTHTGIELPEPFDSHAKQVETLLTELGVL